MTGIPPSCQRLRIRGLGDESDGLLMDAQDEERMQVAEWVEGWRGGRGEILVSRRFSSYLVLPKKWCLSDPDVFLGCYE